MSDNEADLVSAGHEIWFVKKTFLLGKGEVSGLTDDMIKQRLVDGYKNKPWVVEEDTESTQEQIEEEKKNVKTVETGQHKDFPLDTTMTVIRVDGGKLLLHSPVPFDGSLHTKIQDLGQVIGIIAPNLQHWVFLKEWAKYYPDATVYHTPAALGESLPAKLKKYVDSSQLQDLRKCEQIHPDLQHCLLEGAPLMLNETLFFHRPSRTLIAADSFYGGYSEDDPNLTWFSRIWFKITKGAWSSSRLPIYRTSRVKSHGDTEKLLSSVREIVNSWDFKQILFAHGTNPFTVEAKEKFEEAWFSGLAD